MLIEIEDSVYLELLNALKLTDKTLYNKIKALQPQENTLTRARAIKTTRVKENIKEALKELKQANIEPTKYQVHQRTNIAYVTLSKYYDEMLNEVKNG